MCCGRFTGSPYEHPNYIRAKNALTAASVCWICDLPGANSIDHLTPVSKCNDVDEASKPWNLRPAHLSCNQSRGNR